MRFAIHIDKSSNTKEELAKFETDVIAACIEADAELDYKVVGEEAEEYNSYFMQAKHQVSITALKEWAKQNHAWFEHLPD